MTMKDKNEEIKILSPFESASIKATKWIGTPISLVIHTIFFAGIFFLKNFGIDFDQILLILTTAVSLEAIYLAIFIQMTINRQEAKLHEVREDIGEISEDIEELQEDVGEISKDVDELGEGFEEITEDMEEDEKKEEAYRSEKNKNLQKIEITLQSLIVELEKMKEKK